MKTIVKFATDENPIAESQTRTFRFTFSDSGTDRDGDRLNAQGWDLDDYRSNPIVLFAHSTECPIGRASDLKIEGDKLTGSITFAETELADTIFQLVSGGFLKAVSVGFMPISFEFAKEKDRPPGSVNYIRQRLLEVSLVSIPSNPRALLEARYAGIDLAPMVKWVETADIPEADRVVYKSLLNITTEKDLDIGDDHLMAELNELLQKTLAELEKLNKLQLTRKDDGDDDADDQKLTEDDDDMGEEAKSIHLRKAMLHRKARDLHRKEMDHHDDEMVDCYKACHKELEEPEGDAEVEDKDEPTGDDEVVDKQFEQIMARVRASTR